MRRIPVLRNKNLTRLQVANTLIRASTVGPSRGVSPRAARRRGRRGQAHYFCPGDTLILRFYLTQKELKEKRAASS